jgi:hypothetical protein
VEISLVLVSLSRQVGNNADVEKEIACDLFRTGTLSLDARKRTSTFDPTVHVY